MARNQIAIVLSLLAAVVVAPANASEICALSLKPQTSGFFLNPTLEKVLVVKATSKSAEKPCLLQANDELLQINDRVIPGAKARDVMSYWKALPKSAQRTFKVRRNGAIILVATK